MHPFRNLRRLVTLVVIVAVAFWLYSRYGTEIHSPLNPPTVHRTVVSGDYSLLQEPSAGLEPVYNIIGSARSTVEMVMYELADPTAERLLIADAHRGVVVKVLLDSDYHGGEVNKPAYRELLAGGVHVRWAPPSTIYHEKMMVVDGTTAVLGTANLDNTYQSTSVNAWVVDRNHADVAGLVATFNHDFTHNTSPPNTGVVPSGSHLLFSPDSANTFVSAIDSAKTAVDFESEELSDRAVIDALSEAARRGVACRIEMTDSASWQSAFAAVSAAGCKVHLEPDTETAPYIHEKALIINNSTLIIGSQNASYASLTYNREASLVLDMQDAPTVVKKTLAEFGHYFSTSPVWGR